MSTNEPKNEPKKWHEGLEAVGGHIDTTIVEIRGIEGDLDRIMEAIRSAVSCAGYALTQSEDVIKIFGSGVARPDMLGAALKGVARVHPSMQVRSNGTMPRRPKSAVPGAIAGREETALDT